MRITPTRELFGVWWEEFHKDKVTQALSKVKLPEEGQLALRDLLAYIWDQQHEHGGEIGQVFRYEPFSWYSSLWVSFLGGLEYPYRINKNNILDKHLPAATEDFRLIYIPSLTAFDGTILERVQPGVFQFLRPDK